jgi:rhodanese-related sulfurtransferase
MKKIRVFLSLLFSGTLISSCSSQTASSMKPKDFAENIKSENVVVLDVRTPEEYKEGHLKNAVLMNYYDDNFSGQVSALDKNKAVYVYCRSGKRSSGAQKVMLGQGFKSVVNLDGGILSWQQSGLPIEK